MWENLAWWAAVVLMTGVLALLVRHAWRIDELAREDEADAQRLAADDTVKIDVEPAELTLAPKPPARPARWIAEQTLVKLRRDQVKPTRDKPDQDATQVIPVLAEMVVAPVAEPTPPPRRLVSVKDELGTWEPSAHQQIEPKILGDVLAWRKWKTVRPEHVGLSA